MCGAQGQPYRCTGQKTGWITGGQPLIATTERHLCHAVRCGADLATQDIFEADKLRDKVRTRGQEYLTRRAHLLQLADVHDGDAISQRQSLGMVVGDIDRRVTQLIMNASQVLTQTNAQLGVHVR